MAMERPGYERFGLMANPFQDLTSETIEEIELFHVDQDIDRPLSTLKQDVLEKRQRGLVAIVGPLGVGKTERLRVIQSEAERLGAFSAFFQVNYDSPAVVQSLARCLLDAQPSKRFQVSQPGWKKALAAVAKGGAAADPERAGKAFADALAHHAPAFLLVNDLHNMADRPDRDRFLLTLQAMSGHLQEGCLAVMTSYMPFFRTMEQAQPALVSRLNRTFVVPALSAQDAGLLLAKRLAGRRIVEDLAPLYPFEPDAVEAMVQAAGHNPRRFLQVADQVLEKAVEGRAFRITATTVAGIGGDAEAAPAPTDAMAGAGAGATRPMETNGHAYSTASGLAEVPGFWGCQDHDDVRDARPGECPYCDAALEWMVLPPPPQ